MVDDTAASKICHGRLSCDVLCNMTKYELKIYVFPEKIVDKWEEKSLPTNIILSSIVIFPPIKKTDSYNNWIVLKDSTKNQRGSPKQTILMNKATELKTNTLH